MLFCGFFITKKGQIIMKDEEARVNKAMDIALERLEYVIDYRTAPEFVEVTGRVGGDTITYRIYNDGSVYER